MQSRLQRFTPCLWFDDQAEEAVGFYTSVFPNSRIGAITRYTKEAAQVSGRPQGSVLGTPAILFPDGEIRIGQPGDLDDLAVAEIKHVADAAEDVVVDHCLSGCAALVGR